MRSEAEVKTVRTIFISAGDDPPALNTAVRDTLTWVLGLISAEELIDLFASRRLPGRRNHLHLLLVNTARVHPLAWHDPHAADAAYRDDGIAVCEIAGREVRLCTEHWSGGEGRAVFDRAVNRVSATPQHLRPHLRVRHLPNPHSRIRRSLSIIGSATRRGYPELTSTACATHTA